MARRRIWNALLAWLRSRGIHGVVMSKGMFGTRAILGQLKACSRDYLRRHDRRFHVKFQDRVFMEEKILPALAALPEGSSVLFVGVCWFTAHYDTYFQDSAARFVTLEIHPSMSVFGSFGGHITADFLKIESIVGCNVYDVVVMQGVFGYGIDTEADFEKAIRNCYSILKDEGVLIVGWDWGATIEPNPDNIDKIQKYFDPMDAACPLAFCVSFDHPRHEFRSFRKKNRLTLIG